MAVIQKFLMGGRTAPRQQAPQPQVQPQQQPTPATKQRQPVNLGGYGGGGLNVAGLPGNNAGTEMLRSFATPIFHGGTALADIALRLSPIEKAHNSIAALKAYAQGKDAQGINDAVIQDQARKLLWEKVTGLDATAPGNGRKFITDAASMPLWAAGGGEAAAAAKGTGALFNSAATGMGINAIGSGLNSWATSNDPSKILGDTLKGAGQGFVAGAALHGAVSLPGMAVRGIKNIASNAETKANMGKLNQLMSEYKGKPEIPAPLQNIESTLTGQTLPKIKSKSPLLQEAKKYKSAEEFVNSFNLMKSGEVTSIGQLPIGKVNKTQIKAITERGLPHTDTNLKAKDFTPGRKITQPLEVYSKGGSYVVENGNHRLAQAIANGDTHIPVVFKRGEGKSYTTYTKSQLTDLYNKAQGSPLLQEAGIPKTVKVWIKSKFSNDGAYADIPVIRKEDGITLYQGGATGDKRQFWTPDKKYAEQFGNVRKKTGSFYRVNNGNTMTDVYVEAPAKSSNPLLQEAGKPVESRLITRIKQGVTNDPELQAALRQSGTTFEHQTRNTTDLLNRAVDRVTKDPTQAMTYIMTNRSDEATATAFALQKLYQAKGDVSGEISVLEQITPHLTEAGREVQAASLWSRVTPEGILKYAQNKVNKFNELNPGKALKLNPSDATELKKLATEAMNLTGDAKLVATDKVLSKVETLIPSSKVDQVMTLWKAGLLSSPTTHLRNVVGTGGMTGLETAKDFVATPLDKIASMFTGKRTKFLPKISVLVDGAKKGLADAISFAKTGVDLENVMAKIDYKKVNLPPILQKYTDFIFRGLGSEDKLFKGIILKKSLFEQAMSDGWNNGLRGSQLASHAEQLYANPTSEMLQAAMAESSKSTFNNPNALANMVNMGKRNANPIVRGATEFLAPFARTPANVAARILDYAPTGFLKAGYHGATGAGQKTVVEDLARAITGTGIMAGGYGLGKAGMMTGNYPTDPTQRATWDAQGLQPNALKLGGRTYSMNAISPVGNLLGMGSGVQQLQGQVKPEAYPAAVAALGGQTLLNQTFLQGISGALNALQDPARNAGTWLNSAAAGVVPSIIGSATKAIDPVMRQSNGMLDAIQSRIPGLSQNLLPKVDLLGQERTYNNGSPLDRAGQLFNPFTPRDIKQSPVIDEINRLDQSGSSVSASLPGKQISVAGYKVNLTPEEYTRLEKETGGKINEILGNVISNPQYQQASDYDKSNVINKIIQTVRQAWNTQNIGGLTNARDQIMQQVQNKQGLKQPFYTK